MVALCGNDYLGHLDYQSSSHHGFAKRQSCIRFSHIYMENLQTTRRLPQTIVLNAGTGLERECLFQGLYTAQFSAISPCPLPNKELYVVNEVSSYG